MPFLPFVPFLDCAEFVLEGIHSGTAAFLTLGFRFTGPIAAADLLAANAIIDAWYHANLIHHVSQDISFDTIKATDLTSVTGPTVTSTMSAPQQGQVVSPAVPSQVAMSVTFQTALRGRSYRGRNYVPGLPANDLLNGGSWLGAAFAQIQADYQALATAMLAGGWQHVVLSRFNAGARRTVGVATTVNNYVAREHVATQRRRTPGHGI